MAAAAFDFPVLGHEDIYLIPPCKQRSGLFPLLSQEATVIVPVGTHVHSEVISTQ